MQTIRKQYIISRLNNGYGTKCFLYVWFMNMVIYDIYDGDPQAMIINISIIYMRSLQKGQSLISDDTGPKHKHTT